MLTLELSASVTMNYLNKIVGDRTTLHVIDDSCLSLFPFPFQAECERRLLVLCLKNTGNVSEFMFLLSQPGVDPNIYDKVRQ